MAGHLIDSCPLQRRTHTLSTVWLCLHGVIAIRLRFGFKYSLGRVDIQLAPVKSEDPLKGKRFLANPMVGASGKGSCKLNYEIQK